MVTARVLIVDDHEEFRAVARTLLTNAGFDIVGECATGREALHQIGWWRPDAVLLDIALPDTTGLDLCQIIRIMAPAVTVVLCSVSPLHEHAATIADRGAAGYIAKEDFSAAAFRAMLGDG